MITRLLINRAYKSVFGLLFLGVWFARIGTTYSATMDLPKAEEKLVWWTTMAQDQSQKVIEAFMEKHPSIKASYWRSGSNGCTTRL